MFKKKNQCLDEQILCKQTTMYLSYFWSSYWLSKTKVVDAIKKKKKERKKKTRFENPSRRRKKKSRSENHEE